MTHQFSVLNDSLDLLAELAAGANFRSEEVSCGQVTHLEVLLQPRGLGSLAGAGRAEEHGPDAVGGTVGVRDNCLSFRTDGHYKKLVSGKKFKNHLM